KDQNWFVRSAALEAIASLGAPADTPLVRELITSPDAYLRARAVSVGDPAGVALIQALGDADPLVRRSAASALGEMKSKNAVEPLIKLLKDDDTSVRKASAIALGRIGDTSAASAVQGAAS